MSQKLLQIIQHDGTPNQNLEPPLSRDDLLRLYRLLVRTRAFDSKGYSLQRQGRIGFYIGCTGQEACHIGSIYALQPTDWIFPQYREPGIMLHRGWTMQQLIHHLFGNAHDPIKGRQMGCHYAAYDLHVGSISSPIATQIPHAVGAAMAAQYRKDPIVTLTYFGDGATSAGDFHVGMNFAGVFKAPVIFFCQNNGWAISVPLEKQTASESLAIKAVAYGFEGTQVDGNDVLAVYAATRTAAEKARNGDGPTLIEAFTYRLGPHSTADDPTRYREDAEVQAWRSQDPLARFRRYLEKKGLWSDDDERQLQDAAAQEVNDAVRRADETPPPDPETLITDVYSALPPYLREQLQHVLLTRPKEAHDR